MPPEPQNQSHLIAIPPCAGRSAVPQGSLSFVTYDELPPQRIQVPHPARNIYPLDKQPSSSGPKYQRVGRTTAASWVLMVSRCSFGSASTSVTIVRALLRFWPIT